MKKLNTLLFLVFFTSIGHSTPQTCSNVFSPSALKAIGDFQEQAYKPTQNTVLLTEDTINNNQRSLPECYLFAFTGFIEVLNLNAQKNTLASSLATEYLYGRKIIQYINEKILGEPTQYNLEGGFFWNGLSLSKVYGLVTLDSWKPQVPFANWQFNRMQAAIKQEIDVQSQMINSMINLKISPEELAAARANAIQSIAKILLDFTGPLPKEVTFNGEQTTPKYIESKIGLPSSSNIILVVPKQATDYGYDIGLELRSLITQIGGTYQTAQGDLSQMNKHLKKTIDSGFPIYASVNWQNGGHALVITGYEADRVSGEIIRYRFLNSWGEQWSDNGHAWYTPNDVYSHLKYYITLE